MEIFGKIASQPAVAPVPGKYPGLVVFILVEADGKYYKLFYKSYGFVSDMFSDIIVSSIGDEIQVEFLLSRYKEAMEIKKFINKTRGLGDLL